MLTLTHATNSLTLALQVPDVQMPEEIYQGISIIGLARSHPENAPFLDIISSNTNTVLHKETMADKFVAEKIRLPG